MASSPSGKGGRPQSGPENPTLPEQTHVDYSTEVGYAQTIATGNSGTPAPAGGAAEVVASGPVVVITPAPGSMQAGASGAAVAAAASFPALGSNELTPGTVVGEYRIEGKLGEGGMGTVFAAIHPLIGKRAAIKVIKLELCANAEAVERFQQEARAVNQIGHPNIVDVFAFGVLPDGRRYLIMEWLRGESLAARVRRSRLSVEEACDVLEPIARALEAAHEKRIIHRDLKPDNVFMTAVKGEKPIIKLLDFGIAKLVGNEDTRLERTRTGSLLGTPQYISPEQARGKSVDERTDIYSLGAMAFEMFCGRPPFLADNAMDMVSSHLHDAPPSPCSIASELPAALDVLLLGMLEKEPARRPSLTRVREALGEIRKLPVSTRSTVRAEPPAVGARMSTADTIAHPAQVSSETPMAMSRASTTMTARGGGRGKLWMGLGAVVVAGGVAAAMTMGGGKAKPSTAATPVPVAAPVPAPAPAPVPVAAPVPAPAPTVAKGQFELRLNVDDASATVDGKPIVVTDGSARLDLDEGDHVLVISAPGRKQVTKTIHMVAGKTMSMPVHMERAKGGVDKKPPVVQDKKPPPVDDKKPPPVDDKKPPPGGDDDDEGTMDPYGGKKK